MSALHRSSPPPDAPWRCGRGASRGATALRRSRRPRLHPVTGAGRRALLGPQPSWAAVLPAAREGHSRGAEGRLHSSRRLSRRRPIPLLVSVSALQRTVPGLYRPARHADRGREGDQAAGVPCRADAGRSARARPARPRGDRRAGRRAGRGFADEAYAAAGRSRRSRRSGAGRAAPQGEGADRARVRSAARGARPLHVPAHRRGRAADARARRLRDHGDRVRDGRDGRPAPAAARADERGRRAAGAADGRVCLEKAHGGRGILLGGVPGVPPGQGRRARRRRRRLQRGDRSRSGSARTCEVLDRSVDRMRDLENALDGRVTLAMSTRLQIEEVDRRRRHGDRRRAGSRARSRRSSSRARCSRGDEARRGARRRRDRPGRLLRDVARDDARRPVYEVDGIVHYCVANMPGAVPITSTKALTNVTLPYVEAIADKGVARGGRRTIRRSPGA